MARKGISYEDVAAMADALLAQGIKPTFANLRDHLGTGSTSTIHRHLTVWREQYQQPKTEPVELPLAITKVIGEEIDRAKAEARAEIADQLASIKADAGDYAVENERLELELEKKQEEFRLLTAVRDNLLLEAQRQEVEIDQLTKACERECYAAELARTETAEMRLRVELLQQKQVEQSGIIEKLTAKIAEATKARIDADRSNAILDTKLEAETEKSLVLLQEKESLLAQLEVERRTGATTRTEATKMAKELELLTASLSEKMSLYDSEMKCRIEAEKNLAVLLSSRSAQAVESVDASH